MNYIQNGCSAVWHNRNRITLTPLFCTILKFVFWCQHTHVSIFFVCSGSLQNAAYPIDRSILIDFTPSKHRGKWNSIASLTNMTWSGSAVLGGYLVDRHDYTFTFLITAGIYAVGVLCYMPLLWWVPRKENEVSASTPLKLPIPRVNRAPCATMDRLEESITATDTTVSSEILYKEEMVENTSGYQITLDDKKME